MMKQQLNMAAGGGVMIACVPIQVCCKDEERDGECANMTPYRSTRWGTQTLKTIPGQASEYLKQDEMNVGDLSVSLGLIETVWKREGDGIMIFYFFLSWCKIEIRSYVQYLWRPPGGGEIIPLFMMHGVALPLVDNYQWCAFCCLQMCKGGR